MIGLTRALSVALACSLAYSAWVKYDFNSYKLAQAQEDMRLTEVQRDSEIKHFKDKDAIQIQSFEREAASALSAASAASANTRLQQRISSLQRRSSSFSVTQCQSIQDTYGELLGNCTERYTEMGKKAATVRDTATACEQEFESGISSVKP